jgi:hypothetical protein
MKHVPLDVETKHFVSHCRAVREVVIYISLLSQCVVASHLQDKSGTLVAPKIHDRQESAYELAGYELTQKTASGVL